MRIQRLFNLILLLLSILPSASSRTFDFTTSSKETANRWVDPLIEQRGVATSATTNGTTLTINKPAGVVTGDVMIVNISLGRSTANTADPSLTGWTLVSGALFDNNKNYRAAVLYRVATDADASVANYSFALGAGTTGAVGAIVAFANVDVSGATPFDVTPGSLNVSPTVQESAVVANSITTTRANAAVLMLAQSNNDVTWDNALNSATAWRSTNPSTLSELYDLPFTGRDDRLSVGMAWNLKAEAGQTGNGLVNQSQIRNFGAILLALKPIITVVPAPSITSTLTGSTNYGTVSTYQITASYNPTSFSAGTLPTGMSLDVNTGLLTIGANTPAGVHAISLSA
ncbi:MAG: hypothetical protein RI991_1447, partial [Bacteroidota bacterium]